METTATLTGNSFAALDPHYLSQIAKNIGVSLGNNTVAVQFNIDSMKNDENSKSKQFCDEFPELLLPSNLEVDASLTQANTHNSAHAVKDINPQTATNKETWSEVLQKGIDANKQKNVNNDRSILEH